MEEVIIYETLETPFTIKSSYSAILFFSPSAVHSFFSANSVEESTILFAIGNTTAATIKQFSNNTIITSDFPAQDQLMDKAIDYFNNK